MTANGFTEQGLLYLLRHAIEPEVAAEVGVHQVGDCLHFPYGTNGSSYSRRRPLSSNRTFGPEGQALEVWWPAGKPEDASSVLVAEGEADALASLSAWSEISRIVSAVAAVPGTGFPVKRLVEELRSVGASKVFLAFDADQAGRECMKKTAEALFKAGGMEPIALELPEGSDLADNLASREDGPLWLANALADVEAAFEVPELKVQVQPPKGFAPCTPRYAGRRLDMEALLATPDEPIPWRCFRFAADGYLTTMAGRGGEGKSWVTLGLAHGVHEGRTVAGIPCEKGVAVVFDAENGAKLLKKRFRAAGIGAGTVQPFDADGLHIVKDLDWFKEMIEAEGANLAIFDSLRILSSGVDENNTEEIEPIMSALRRLARETGAAIVLVHHRGRDETSSYRGSSAIRDGTDLLFKFGRVKEDPERRHRRVLETVKCRIDEEPEPHWVRIQADRAKGLVYLDEAEPYEGGTGAGIVRAVLADELLELMDDEPRTRASLARDVGRDPKDGSVGNALKALAEGGRAERAGGGWKRCKVQTPIGLAPCTPDSSAERWQLDGGAS